MSLGVDLSKVRLARTRHTFAASSSFLTTGIASLAVAAAVGAFPRLVERLVIILLVAGLTFFQSATLRRVVGRWPIAVIPIAAFNLVAVFGVLFYPRQAALGTVSATFINSGTLYNKAAVIFALASGSVWGGAMLAAVFSDRRLPTRATDVRAVVASVARHLKPLPTLLASMLPLALGVIGFSFSAVLRRPTYLTTYGPPSFAKIATIIIPIGVAAAAAVYFSADRPSVRNFARIVLIAYGLYLFASGSRTFGMFPLVLLGVYLALPDPSGDRRRLSGKALLVAVVSAFILLNLPLAIRSGTAGLLPFAGRVVHDPTVFFPRHPIATLANILFAVPLTGAIVVRGGHLPISDFFIAVNPLPGSMTGWGGIQGALRLNEHTPFNTFGELALYGTPLLVAYFAFIGFSATKAQLWISSSRRVAGARALLSQLILAIAMLLFSARSLQYNVRSVTRIWWYAVILILILSAFRSREVEDG